jgi:hypothetical protein
MTKKKKLLTPKKKVGQADFVLDYLLRRKAKGATNFEMMVRLQICDVRKRISEINSSPDCKYIIASEWEVNEDTGARYKRYYAYERKRNNKISKSGHTKKR